MPPAKRERPEVAQSEQAERTALSNDAWLRQGAADARGEITELLCQWQQGSQEAQELLFRKIYHLLHRLAARRLDEHGMATLQVTEVVHEAYLRLVDQRRSEWQNRAHFFAISSRVIRRVIADHVRAKRVVKRGGALAWVPLEEAHLVAPQRHADVLDLDRALDELEAIDEDAVRLVEMRYFGGMTIDEAAIVMRLGRTSTVGKWKAARAWLRTALRSVSPHARAAP